MIDTNPNLEWYTKQSNNAGLSTRCEFANVHRCPRYYSSLYLLGELNITTKIKSDKIKQLDKHWEDSELMPVINEHDTGIGSSDGKLLDFNNYCPEIAYDIFGLFVTSLCKYTDEIDKDVAHSILEKNGASGDNWRWQWMYIKPMHYSNCPLYSQILTKKITLDTKKATEAKPEEIITLKPSFFGLSINLKALLKKIKRGKNI